MSELTPMAANRTRPIRRPNAAYQQREYRISDGSGGGQADRSCTQAEPEPGARCRGDPTRVPAWPSGGGANLVALVGD